jgi:hypothetical protein
MVLLAAAAPGKAQALAATVKTGSLTATNASCTATACVAMPVSAAIGAVGWQISGTFAGTFSFEGTVDGTNWVAVAALPVGLTRTLASSTTAAGAWVVNVVGLSSVRVRCSAYTSGTAVVVGRTSVPPSPTS